MIKFLTMTILLAVVSVAAYTQEFTYFFNFNWEDQRFHLTDKHLYSYSEENFEQVITNNIRALENIYMFQINYEIIRHVDSDSNAVKGCIINIVADDDNYMFENYKITHTVKLWVAVNFLQPYTSGWEIDYVLIQFNGIFTDYIISEAISSSLLTRTQFDESLFNLEGR